MFKILQQLQNDCKQVALFLSIDLWVIGYISYLDEEIVSLEGSERDGVYYTQVLRLSNIIGVEFISDRRISDKDKHPFDLKSKDSGKQFEDDFNDDDEPFNPAF